MPELRSITREAVLEALAEAQRLGRREFRAKYGYGGAADYTVLFEDEEYDSKAIVGVAYGYVHPDHGPLTPSEFSGGLGTVVLLLEDLEFEVLGHDEQPPADLAMRNAWISRAGQDGENEALALSHNCVVLGWQELGDLSHSPDREEIKALISQNYPGSSDRSVAGQAGSVVRFVNEMKPGDVAVLPLKRSPGHVAVGEITGDYRFRTEPEFQNDAVHTRDVNWITTGTPSENFEQELRDYFRYQGAVRLIDQPDAPQRLLAAVQTPTIELLVKWSAKFGADTANQHRQLAETHGGAWWGLVSKDGSPRLNQPTIDQLREQLAAGIVTHVYVVGPSDWRTTLQAVTLDRGEVDENLVPGLSDSSLTYGGWLKLGDFEPLERSWLTQNLELASRPGAPLGTGALSNQTTPIVVRRQHREATGSARVWWVCQGATYPKAAELGVLWAPKVAKDGNGRPYWRALKDAAVGDRVVHYANRQVRAVGTVTAEAIDAPQSQAVEGDWDADGWLLTVEYAELPQPLALGEIPVEWRIEEGAPFTVDGAVQQGYFYPLSDAFVNRLAHRFPQLGLTSTGPNDGAGISYEAPDFDAIKQHIAKTGLRLEDRTLRRYHLSLASRGFVILAGVSGSGKTWLAEAYADAVSAVRLVVPVAPNWTTNEDLIGFYNPIDKQYSHTEFSRFLQQASAEYADAQATHREPRPYHLVLDEMNLARVEYYFAKFLSTMEARERDGTAFLKLAEDFEVNLTPNLRFIGTVNVDETTFGLADKVYDRAQLVVLEAPRDALADHLNGKSYKADLLAVWDAVEPVAPFAFRVLDDIEAYVQSASLLGVGWQEALDEQILQKVLPKVKGIDPKIRGALENLLAAAEEQFPLSAEKTRSMLSDFETHGFVSYF